MTLRTQLEIVTKVCQSLSVSNSQIKQFLNEDVLQFLRDAVSLVSD